MASPEAAAVSCDEHFHRTVAAIEKRLHLLGRQPQVRVKAWLVKLKVSTSNLTWKRNRNLYARLLLEQLRAGCLEVPFNAMPPEGSLPTLPAYLTYRFISPPRQRPAEDEEGFDAAEQQRPGSAGCDGGLFRHRSPPGAHSAWTVMRASAPMQLQHSQPNAAGIAPNLANYPAISPIRCGSPPRRGYLPDQQQQQQQVSSPNSRGRGYKAAHAAYASPDHIAAHRGAGHVVAEAGPPLGYAVQQRPTSPGAAGLLNAAAVLAAEVEAGRGDAAVLESRLRYAEDKLLQQEAELVRLQGQAVAARRRLKAATASTLGDLVERYSSAAAAWDSSGSPTAAGKPPSRQAAYAEAVYGPMWQLIASMQQVLDSCDQQDFQWQQAQAGAAAAAIAKFDAALVAQEQAAQEAGLAGGQGAAGQYGDSQQAAEAAAANEQAVLKQVKEVLNKLLQQAEQVVAAMLASKNAATAAAAGGRVTAAEVAAGAADALRALLKSAKRFVSKERQKLVQQLKSAADAVAAAVSAADKSRRSSGSSDGGSGTGSDNSIDDRHSSRLQGEQQRQQGRAQLGRLQTLHKLVLDLEESSSKMLGQLVDGQNRLLDVASNSNSSSASNSVLASHDRGLAAAATAGITASLGAATSAYVARLKETKQQLKAVSKAAATGASIGDSSVTIRQPGLSRVSSAAVRFQDSNPQQPSLSRLSSAALRFEGSDAPLSPRQNNDATLAGTFGGLSSPRSPSLSLLNPGSTLGLNPNASDATAGKFNSIAHYLIGGAAAHGSPGAGAGLLTRPPVSPRLSSPPQQHHGNNSSSGAATAGGADTIHQRLANLSRQASRISERAGQLLGTGSGNGNGHTGGSPEPTANARAASPGLLGVSLLTGSLATNNSTMLRQPSASAFGSSLLGEGLKSSPTAAGTASRLPNASMFSPTAGGLGTGRLGALGSTGSLLAGGGVSDTARPASASPRLSGFASGSITSGLLGSAGRPSALGGNLASLSSRLNSLGRI